MRKHVFMSCAAAIDWQFEQCGKKKNVSEYNYLLYGNVKL